MKCPHCDYIHGWDNVSNENVIGDKGKFYELPIKMERTYPFDNDRIDVYGCPNCMKIFMCD